MSDTVAGSEQARAGGISAREWVLVVAASCATGVVWLSVSEFTVVLPQIQHEFDASLGELQWISSVSFTLSLTALLIAGGRLGDLLGHRRVLGMGLLVFAAMSVACAVAWSATALIVARGGQGIGAALLLTTSLALIANAIPARGRGLAVGVYGGVLTLMQGIGPLIGGAFAAAGMWQLVFWANLPIAAIIWIALRRTAPEKISAGATSDLDVPGILAIVAATGGATLALINGSSWGWVSGATIACWIVAALGLVAFVARERAAAAPLVMLARFRNPLFSGAVGLVSAMNASLIVGMFFLALYFQYLLGHSAFMAGVLFLPLPILAVLAGPLSGRAFDRLGPRLPNVAAIAFSGFGTLALAVAALGDDYVLVLPGLVMFAIGAAAVASTTGGSVVQAVPARDEGAAAGVLTVGATLASTLGLALAAPLFTGVADHSFERDVARAGLRVRIEPGEVTAILSDSQTGRRIERSVRPSGRAQLRAIARSSFREGLVFTLLFFGFVCVAAIPIALATQRRRWLDPRTAAALRAAREGPG